MTAIEDLIEEYGNEYVQRMADMTRRYATLDAVVFSKSTDINTIAEWMWNDKDRTAPLEFCIRVAEEYLPLIVEDGLIVDGEPTAEAIELACLHQQMLTEDLPVNS